MSCGDLVVSLVLIVGLISHLSSECSYWEALLITESFLLLFLVYYENTLQLGETRSFDLWVRERSLNVGFVSHDNNFLIYDNCSDRFYL